MTLITDAVCDAKTGKTVLRQVDVPQADLDAQIAAGVLIEQQEAVGRTLADQADQALINLRAYRNLANPTNAQTAATVKLLCGVCIAIIRLLLRRLDSTD